LKRKTSSKLSTNKSTTNQVEIKLTVTLRFTRIADVQEKLNSSKRKILPNAAITDNLTTKKSDTNQKQLMQKEQRSISIKSLIKDSTPERKIKIRQSNTIPTRTSAGENSKIALSTDTHEGQLAAQDVEHREAVGEHLEEGSKDQMDSCIKRDLTTTTTATRNEPRNTHPSKSRNLMSQSKSSP
jgi:hypothetical protein